MMRIDTRAEKEHRTRTLLRAAAAAAATPEEARDWLHSPHPRIGGIAPSAASWIGGELADQAMALVGELAQRDSV